MFDKKSWLDRISQFPRQRLLTPASGGDGVLYNVSRAEGTVTEAGDSFSANTMNDLERRIEAETNIIESAIGLVHRNNKAGSLIRKDTYFVKGEINPTNGIFYRALADIPSGTTFTNQNCVALTIADALAALNGSILNVSTSVSGLANSTNNSINAINTETSRLGNEITYVDSVRPRGKLVTFGTELRFNNGLATTVVNCADVLPQGWRASAAFATLDGRSDEFLIASLTEADRTRVGVAIHTVINTSYSGTFNEVGLVIWGNRA